MKRLRSLVVSSRSLVRYEDAFEDAGGIILGEGRQVVVRQAIRREDRAVVAVRRLTTRDVSLAELHRQLSIFELVSKQCVHRNIVKIEGLSFSDDDESLHVMFKIYRWARSCPSPRSGCRSPRSTPSSPGPWSRPRAPCSRATRGRSRRRSICP